MLLPHQTFTMMQVHFTVRSVRTTGKSPNKVLDTEANVYKRIGFLLEALHAQSLHERYHLMGLESVTIHSNEVGITGHCRYSKYYMAAQNHNDLSLSFYLNPLLWFSI